ncbi:MAG: RNA 3'-terminal phosphate cyclase (ATP), partial [Polyangiales bacterium]
MTTIRNILNTAKWRNRNLHQLSLVVTHRGAPNERRSVLGSRIEKVEGEGILIKDPEEGTKAFLPYHRVIEMRDDEGSLVWDREGGLHALPEPVATVAEARDSSVNVVVEGDGILTIDGSAGEGGGQILRSSLTLSMLTGQPFRLVNIRAGRRKAGLKRQHLTCVEAARVISGAKVQGASLHSGELVFEPGEVSSGEYAVDVGTAGSVALVLQTIALPLALAKGPSSVRIGGGTHARWAPPLPFLLDAWLPWVRRIGVQMELKLNRAGFFPAGGGEVVATFEGASALNEYHAKYEGGDLELEAHAVVSNLPEGIARRELMAVETEVPLAMTLHAATVRSPGPGNACWLIAWGNKGDGENVFSAIGEKNTPAEEVAGKVSTQFMEWYAAGVCADEHLANQLLLPMALAGGGSFTTTTPSLHTWTNIAVIHAFGLPRFAVTQSGESFEV